MAINIFAMPSASVILLLSAVFGISNGLPWTGPRPTNAYKEAAWSPAPTFVPVNPVELFKRSSVDVNVCGWIGGNSANAATCSVGSSCIRDTVHRYVGCCTTSGACTQGVYTSCVDSNNAGWTPNAGLEDNGIYTCTGTSVCYRNTYPGGYFQYGCGASGDAAQVATTYSGQPSDLLLQVVYTGVNFTPTSAARISPTAKSSATSRSETSSISPLPTSSSITSRSESSSTSPLTSASSSTGSSKLITSTTTLASQTIPTASKESSSITSQAAVSATSTPAPAKKVTTGVIAGSTVAGVAAVVGLLAVLFWFCRRKRANRKPLRAGSFITQHQTGHSPVSGPFQRISPFSPEDYPSPRDPLAAHPMNTTPPEQDITGAFTYGGPEMSQPSGAAERWGPVRRTSQPTENVPLVSSEIDDFSNGYNNAVSRHNTHIDTAPNASPGLDMGAAIGIGALSGRRGSEKSNHGTQNRDLTAEAFRSSRRVRNQSQNYVVKEDGWTPQGLRGSSAEMNLRGGGASYSGSSSNSGSADGRNGSGDGDVSPEIPIPPKSPLRQSMRKSRMGSLSCAAAAPLVADSPVDASRKRYQLVDEVYEREDVPILNSPGQLRNSRIGKRGR